MKPDFKWNERKRIWCGLPWTFTKYGMNDDRIFVRKGFLNIKETEVRLYRILNISISRSFIQRIFRLGTIHIETVVLLSKLKPDDIVKVEIDLDELDATPAEMKATYQEIKEYISQKYGLKAHTAYISQIKRKCGIEMGLNYNLSKKENSKARPCPPYMEEAIYDALKHFAMV